MTVDFTHLHVHTEFSLLDGLSRVKQLVARAKELRMDALALTDHGGMYAAIDFYTRCKEAGIKPLIGVELYIAPRGMHQKEAKLDQSPYHLVLLAADRTGYRNLLYLTSQAHLEGFYYKPRVDKELLAKHAKGLVALSACGSGEVPRLLFNGNPEGARQAARWYSDLFGPGRFFLEIQEHDLPEMVPVNRELVTMSREMALPLVATNDIHFVEERDAPAQEILLCIQTNATLDDPKHLRLSGNGYHMRTQEEMSALFRETPEAISNTRLVVDQCNLKLDFDRLHLPEYTVPDGHTPDTYLAELCQEGLQRRYHPVTPEAEERLRYELDVIAKTGFPLYILIVRDLAMFARQQGIPFGVRGSAASSIVCYCSGITDIDPLYWELPFERFLNVERKQMPDIDMDFADTRRAEMIDYVTAKYGRDHVAQIITFGTLGARAAIRDVARVLNCDLSYVDRLAKLVPQVPDITLDRAIAETPELRAAYETDDLARRLIDTAKSLEGVARHASTHAAGVVISKDPLVHHVPLQRAGKGEEGVMCQYDMNVLEKIGLLKMDFLGLANLTILGRALETIRATRGETVDLQSIPLEDPKAFQLLSRGETTAIFQLEGSGMRRYIKELGPTTVADVAAMVALYRPGPMNAIPQYIAAKHGEVPVTYLHPILEPILKPTYGVLVYQDQVLFIARAVAGYSLGQADILRKAMGKKIAEQMKKEEANFISGARQRGVPEETAMAIWDQIEPFAGYGFNKAHAVCYAFIAYQTAYLKANYPSEYMCAVLESATGDMDKVATAIAECRRLGIQVLPPHINLSQAIFSIGQSDPAHAGAPAPIRFGLAAVKNVGEGPVAEILSVRAKSGPFRSVEDFCQRAGSTALNKRVLESLIKGGAFASLSPRKPLLDVLDRLLGIGQATQHALQVGQSTFFDMMPGDDAPILLALPSIPEADYQEILAWEKDLLGVYLSEHPLQKVAERLKDHITCLCGQIDVEMVGQKVVLAGMVTSARRIVTKKGDTMAFVQLEDVQGSVEVTVFPKTYQRTQNLWEPDRIVLLRGKVEARDDKIQVICDAAEEYANDSGAPASSGAVAEELPALLTAKPRSTPHAAPPPPRYFVHISLPRRTDANQARQDIALVAEVLSRYPGEDWFTLYVSNGSGKFQFRMPDARTRYCPELDRELVGILGAGSVTLDRV
jgi:DNA polymerase-3 subunit alpha